MKTHYVDVHCHPSLKPYSKSFKYEPNGQNALDPGRKNSIWHYSPPTVLEKFIKQMFSNKIETFALKKVDGNIDEKNWVEKFFIGNP